MGRMHDIVAVDAIAWAQSPMPSLATTLREGKGDDGEGVEGCGRRAEGVERRGEVEERSGPSSHL